MSYQLQFRSLAEEFRKAGLSGDAAVRIAQILSNSAQPMRSGPVEVDTTPSGMRKVDGSRRKHQLTSLDFRDGDPYHRKKKLQRTEDRPRPTQASAIQSAHPPQSSDKPFNVSPGSFAETRSMADGVELGLRVAGTGPFLTQDQASGTLIGKSLRAEADAGENGFLRFFVEEQAGEYVFRLQIDRSKLRELVFELLGLDAPSPSDDQFPQPTPASLAFVNATLDGRGLCFQRANGSEVCLPTVACDQQQ